MSCSSTSQLTNASSVPLTLTRPQTDAQWAVFVQRLQDMLNATRDAAGKTGINVIPAALALYDAPALPALTVTGATAALDTSKTQFGNASLKLTATAATVTLTFTGDPIKITPYQRWIESVYIQSSRAAIAGTLAVVTAAGTYPVDISGNLLPSTWGRLYGDCSLVADDSTAVTLMLTLTGCSVGDTFNLEGWQLEQANGSTNLPSAFVNSAAPGSQDAVPDSSTYVRLDASHASNNVAYNYRGVWSSATAYVIGDEVVYSGSYWLSLANSTNSAPAQGNGNWQVVGAYNNYQGAWSSTVTYYPGQEATYSGNYWVCATQNVNSAPSTSNANWVIAGPQNLDKVPDGTARFAVVNGGGLNAVAAVDPNKKALIDFSQSGHLSKNLDYIADTSSHIRTAAVAETASYLPIDNPTCYLPANPDGSLPGWDPATQNAHLFYIDTGSPDTGYAQDYAIESTSGAGFISSRQKWTCYAGDVFTLTARVKAASGVQCGVILQFKNASGTVLGQIFPTTASTSWTTITGTLAAPSGTAYAQLTFYITAPGFAALQWIRVATNDLRVAGSGATVGDQRNLLPVTWAGVRSVLSTSPISYSISGTTVNVTVAAVTVNAGGVNVSYNASSGSVSQAAGTTVTYYCYYRDAAASGGSKSLYITTSVQALAAYPDIVMLGSFTATVASGGGGTGGSGSGGGGYCVADDMFIGDDRRAGDADIGDPFDCIDLPTAAGKHQRALQGVTRGVEECVRMITSDGCALVCSVSTPFDLPDGRSTTALHMLGEQVITDLGTATVTSLALVGPRPVTRAHMGGVSYAAGADPKRRIYSHNVGTEKP